MKNICLIFTGAIRESLKDIRRNIKDIKDCFSDHNIDVIFITWKSNDKISYDENELKKQIDGIVDFFIVQDMRNISDYPRTGDNNSTIQFFPIIDAAKFLRENNLVYDNVVRLRHDNHFVMNNINSYLEKSFYVPPCYHLPHWLYNKNITSSHMFITTYENFLKYEEYQSYIYENSSKFTCTENLDAKLMSNISDIEFIDDKDIVKFKNRNFPGKGFVAREWK